MMVPRSFMRPPGHCDDTGRRRKSRKSSPVSSRSPSPRTRPLLLRPTIEVRPPPTPVTISVTQHQQPPHTARAVTEPTKFTTSLPMIIPPRRDLAKTITTATIKESRDSQRPTDVHDPNAVPPAMAALLALTEIPHPRGRTFRKKRPFPRRVSIEQLREEWKKDLSTSSSLGNGSPLDFLLEPAEPAEVQSEEDELVLEVDTDKEGHSLSSRSVSSDSIHSTPSLYTTESTISTWGTPLTPTPSVLRRLSRQERREKFLSSPPPQECFEHPLLENPSAESLVLPDRSKTPVAITSHPRQAPTPRSTFKSNLTAKFQAFKSAVGSFSNFAAPSIPSDDLLTRSLFSPRYPPEMRPKGFMGVPDPALRRYLNPSPANLSSQDFTVQLREALGAIEPVYPNDPDAPAPPMIQMRTYSRTTARTRARRSSSGSPFDKPEFPPPGTVPEVPPASRQREPRENSDFLRVIVLEMNMRRIGKLDPKAGGRARVWLPPRRGGDVNVTVVEENGRGIPGRWIGVSVEDLSE